MRTRPTPAADPLAAVVGNRHASPPTGTPNRRMLSDNDLAESERARAVLRETMTGHPAKQPEPMDPHAALRESGINSPV